MGSRPPGALPAAKCPSRSDFLHETLREFGTYRRQWSRSNCWRSPAGPGTDPLPHCSVEVSPRRNPDDTEQPTTTDTSLRTPSPTWQNMVAERNAWRHVRPFTLAQSLYGTPKVGPQVAQACPPSGAVRAPAGARSTRRSRRSSALNGPGASKSHNGPYAARQRLVKTRGRQCW